MRHARGEPVEAAWSIDGLACCSMVCVADERLRRVLTADPATGIFRHVDAGYDRASQVAAERGVVIPK